MLPGRLFDCYKSMESTVWMALLSTLYSTISSQFPNLILVSVLLTSSRSRTLLWGFRCGLWTCKCRLVCVSLPECSETTENIGLKWVNFEMGQFNVFVNNFDGTQGWISILYFFLSFAFVKTDEWTLWESHRKCDTWNLCFSPHPKVTIKEQG